jgi:hypothetical protein
LPDFTKRVTSKTERAVLALLTPGGTAMHRSWRGVLLFALALAIQAFAPAAANIAMAQPSGDSRVSFVICLQTGGSPADQQHRLPGQHNNRQHDACPLCQISCSGVAPLEARPNLAGLAPVQWTALAWTVADRALPAPRHESSHQPRAPPALS